MGSSYTLTASASGLTSTASNSFIITAGAATQLAITSGSLPSSITSGDNFGASTATATVTAQDAAGNTNTSYTGTLSAEAYSGCSTSDGPINCASGTLISTGFSFSGSSSFTSGVVSSVALSSLSYSGTAGTIYVRFKATPGSGSSIYSGYIQITVRPGPAARVLSLSGIPTGDITSLQNFTISGTVGDQFRNALESGASGTVSLELIAATTGGSFHPDAAFFRRVGAAVIPLTRSTTAAIASNGSFSSTLAVNIVGSYKIRAQVGSGLTLESSQFNIVQDTAPNRLSANFLNCNVNSSDACTDQTEPTEITYRAHSPRAHLCVKLTDGGGNGISGDEFVFYDNSGNSLKTNAFKNPPGDFDTTLLSTTNSNGIACFNILDYGPKTTVTGDTPNRITVRDKTAGSGFVVIKSIDVNVTPGDAHQLGFSGAPSSTAIAGQKIGGTLKIIIQDVAGNTVEHTPFIQQKYSIAAHAYRDSDCMDEIENSLYRLSPGGQGKISPKVETDAKGIANFSDLRYNEASANSATPNIFFKFEAFTLEGNRFSYDRRGELCINNPSVTGTTRASRGYRLDVSPTPELQTSINSTGFTKINNTPVNIQLLDLYGNAVNSLPTPAPTIKIEAFKADTSATANWVAPCSSKLNGVLSASTSASSDPTEVMSISGGVMAATFSSLYLNLSSLSVDDQVYLRYSSSDPAVAPFCDSAHPLSKSASVVPSVSRSGFVFAPPISSAALGAVFTMKLTLKSSEGSAIASSQYFGLPISSEVTLGGPSWETVNDNRDISNAQTFLSSALNNVNHFFSDNPTRNYIQLSLVHSDGSPLSGAAPALLSETARATSSSSGFVLYKLSIDTPGEYKIKASFGDAANAPFILSSPITISSGALSPLPSGIPSGKPAYLQLITPPNQTQTAHETFQGGPVVQIKDSAGNPVNDVNGILTATPYRNPFCSLNPPWALPMDNFALGTNSIPFPEFNNGKADFKDKLVYHLTDPALNSTETLYIGYTYEYTESDVRKRLVLCPNEYDPNHPSPAVPVTVYPGAPRGLIIVRQPSPRPIASDTPFTTQPRVQLSDIKRISGTGGYTRENRINSKSGVPANVTVEVKAYSNDNCLSEISPSLLLYSRPGFISDGTATFSGLKLTRNLPGPVFFGYSFSYPTDGTASSFRSTVVKNNLFCDPTPIHGTTPGQAFAGTSSLVPSSDSLTTDSTTVSATLTLRDGEGNAAQTGRRPGCENIGYTLALTGAGGAGLTGTSPLTQVNSTATLPTATLTSSTPDCTLTYNNLRITKPGTYTFTVTFPDRSSKVVSRDFDVGLGVAHHLHMTAGPATSVAPYTALNPYPILEIHDAKHNVRTSDEPTVTIGVCNNESCLALDPTITVGANPCRASKGIINCSSLQFETTTEQTAPKVVYLKYSAGEINCSNCSGSVTVSVPTPRISVSPSSSLIRAGIPFGLGLHLVSPQGQAMVSASRLPLTLSLTSGPDLRTLHASPSPTSSPTPQVSVAIGANSTNVTTDPIFKISAPGPYELFASPSPVAGTAAVSSSSVNLYAQPSLSAGSDFSCLVDQSNPNGSGVAKCWGKTPVPEASVVAISASGNRACGLKLDGTTTCWACSSNGTTCTRITTHSPPPDVSFSMISAGHRVTCGIRVDNQSISCYGLTQSPNTTSTADRDFRIKYKQVAVGQYGFAGIIPGTTNYVCAIKTDDKVECWNYHGDSNAATFNVPTSNFYTISAGVDHACGIIKDTSNPALDGTVTCWGNVSNFSGQPPANLKFKAIAAGQNLTCGLLKANDGSDGTIRCWGNANTQFPAVNSVINGVPPSGQYSEIAVGSNHACALPAPGSTLALSGRNTSSYAPVCWGSNGSGQSLSLTDQFCNTLPNNFDVGSPNQRGVYSNLDRSAGMCRLGNSTNPQSSCPRNWVQLNNWSATIAAYRNGESTTSCPNSYTQSCTTGFHASFRDKPVESCDGRDTYACGPETSRWTHYATITEIGCIPTTGPVTWQ